MRNVFQCFYNNHKTLLQQEDFLGILWHISLCCNISGPILIRTHFVTCQ
jgi:hypothetical protein